MLHNDIKYKSATQQRMPYDTKAGL